MYPFASFAYIVILNGLFIVCGPIVSKSKWWIVWLATVNWFDVPLIPGFEVSVTVIVWTPTVFIVVEAPNVWVPLSPPPPVVNV